MSRCYSEHPTNLAVVLDPYQVTYERYNPLGASLPTIFLVSPAGTVDMMHVGYSPDSVAQVRRKVLGGK